MNPSVGLFEAVHPGHVPVMLGEVLAALEPRAEGVYLDGTFGGGGYAAAILAAADCTLWAIDRDPDAITRGAAMAARHGERLHLVEGSFSAMLALLAARGVSRLDGVVLDLGVSSFQLDEAERGFSFRSDGPLDMRMSRHGPSAADLVATLPEGELADTLYELGEERLSRRIARAIVQARATAAISRTLQLADIISDAVPAMRPRPGQHVIHPATRSFQALRIRVNDELGEVARALDDAAQLLAPGGRLVVVSFHSLEDRIVKRFMLGASGQAPAPSRHDPRGLDARERAQFRLLTRRAARPSAEETARNPRARSARLRAVEKLAASPYSTQDATPASPPPHRPAEALS